MHPRAAAPAPTSPSYYRQPSSFSLVWLPVFSRTVGNGTHAGIGVALPVSVLELHRCRAAPRSARRHQAGRVVRAVDATAQLVDFFFQESVLVLALFERSLEFGDLPRLLTCDIDRGDEQVFQIRAVGV